MLYEALQNACKTVVVHGMCAVGILCLSASLLAAPVEEAIGAKVIEITGQVEIGVPGQPPAAAAAGDFIYEGSELTIPRGGAATLAMYDKTLREFTGPSTVTISRDRIEAGTVLGNLTAAVADMLFSSNRPASQAVMATRAIGDASNAVSLPILTQPAPGENLTDMPRQFKWRGIRGVPLYRITVYSASEMMWQATTAETEIHWPIKDCHFEPGQTYYWVVEALVGNTTLRSEAGDFTLLDKDGATQLSRGLSEAATSTAEPARSLALQARLCLDMHAYSEALDVLDTAIETAPSREAFVLRAEVNDALGLKEEALSDYRKAMDLPSTD
jgi:hypothetical protein